MKILILATAYFPYVGGIGSKDGVFGAGEIVLRLFGDLLEKGAPCGVV